MTINSLSPIAVGIDPGVNTGFAIWDCERRALIKLETLSIHQAMQAVREISLVAAEFNRTVIVIFEDARKRTWFGGADARQAKYGAAIREGVGAVKRDAKIWEDFLTDLGVPFVARKPQPGTTKLKADRFKMLSKWEERTSEHARDAGMLVIGLDEPGVKSLLRFAQPTK